MPKDTEDFIESIDGLATTVREALHSEYSGEGYLNVVDVIRDTSHSIGKIANAIMPLGRLGDEDAGGTFVESLTESVMGLTKGSMAIAASIDNLADAIRESSRR